MSVKPTIIFDLDGTLADTIQDLVAALNRTIAVQQLPPFKPLEVAPLIGKGGLRAMICHAFELAGRQLEVGQLEAMFAETAQDYDNNIAIETILYPSVRGSLETFRAEGWLLSVCTNKPIGQAKKLLHKLGIDHLFAAVTGADSFEFKKPDARHLIRTIEISGGNTQKAVMVGDTYTDIITARNAGIPVVAVDFGYSDIDVSELAPDCVISRFGDLFTQATDLVQKGDLLS